MIGLGKAGTRNSIRGEATIQDFANSDLTTEQSRRQAAALLNSKELLRNLGGLTAEDQTKFLDKIDQVYPTVAFRDVKILVALGEVCRATERLPTSVALSAGLQKRGDIAVGSGGLADIWLGEYKERQVAIKSYRIYSAQSLKRAKEILWARIPTWRKLSHENILPFCGIDTTLFQLALVYDWGQNGNINQYMASHPDASRPSLLFDVARGLEYLHSLDISHGDLKGTNVVIDRNGHARLTEFGLAPINSGPCFTATAHPEAVGSSGWLAPELMNPSHNATPVTESKPADVFAFSMLAVGVLTGEVPSKEQENETAVLRVLEGGRPEMPGNAQAIGLTREMWELLERCWQVDPKKRPTMEEVVRKWGKFVGRDHNDDGTTTEKPQPTVGLASGASRPRVKSGAAKSRTWSAARWLWKKWLCGLF